MTALALLAGGFMHLQQLFEGRLILGLRLLVIYKAKILVRYAIEMCGYIELLGGCFELRPSLCIPNLTVPSALIEQVFRLDWCIY